MSKNLILNRRAVLKYGGAASVALATPYFFTRGALAEGENYRNAPKGDTVTLRLQRAADRRLCRRRRDELRAYQFAVEHINGEATAACCTTFSSKALRAGINGKKVAFVTGDTQTKSDAARASAKRMIENDGAIMITGGSSSGVAIAVQGLCQEAGVIFMAGLTHSNDTTGKDKRANGFRHFFNTEMSGAALAPVLQKNYGNDRKAYHLTADYTWGWSQEGSIKKYTEAVGWETVAAFAPRSARATTRSTSRRS